MSRNAARTPPHPAAVQRPSLCELFQSHEWRGQKTMCENQLIPYRTPFLCSKAQTSTKAQASSSAQNAKLARSYNKPILSG
jgi:hypothetical protein